MYELMCVEVAGVTQERKFNPDDIQLPTGYHIEVFAKGLTAPINMVFTRHWDILVADAGVVDGNGKVMKYTGEDFVVIADGFTPPLTGINVNRDNIYVSHRGTISVIQQSGKRIDILSGLPSFGDHHNNQVIFGPDGKMYFGQGTATNSGVVGVDNSWVTKHPYFHDYPGQSIRLTGENFVTPNILVKPIDESPSKRTRALTGAFSPFGVPTKPGEKVKGITAAGGSILRANPDGTELELVAWGLRNPFRLKFDLQHRLFASNHGMDERGSRPIANSPDEFQRIQPGMWYGFPDFTGGLPVTMPQFRPEGKPQPSFLLAKHPMLPPEPVAVFPPHSAAMGFDFNVHPQFGPVGDAFIAEFGSGAPGTTGGKPAPKVGHRVSRIDMKSGHVKTFAINKTGGSASANNGGGLERPIDVVFGPHGDMYVVDMGIVTAGFDLVPGTGAIWRITRK
jgi:glucose/arabinose dehydrogenase